MDERSTYKEIEVDVIFDVEGVPADARWRLRWPSLNRITVEDAMTLLHQRIARSQHPVEVTRVALIR
jgi:hypothetical protein